MRRLSWSRPAGSVAVCILCSMEADAQMGDEMVRPLIAVIEVDAALRKMLCELLTSEGYDVHPVHNSDEAMALLRRVQPTVIVMEAWLASPTDARQVFDHLTTDPATSGIPVIVLTDDPRLPDGEADILQRAAAIMEKPFDLTDLLAVVHQASEQR